MNDDEFNYVGFITVDNVGKNDPSLPENQWPLREGLPMGSKNIYYYWHLFLRMQIKYIGKKPFKDRKNISVVYEDFDVYDNECFLEWWHSCGRYLFSRKYETESEALSVDSFGVKAQNADGISIFFPFDGHIDSLIKQAKVIFEKARDDYDKRTPDKRVKYWLKQRKYDTTKLHNQAVIFEAVQMAPDKTKFFSIFHDIKDKLVIGDDLLNMNPERIKSYMSYNYDQACRLLYHVARGRFPDYSDPPIQYNLRRPKPYM